MAGVFESISIRGMSLPNRFVRSATWEGLATAEGKVTPQLIKLMVRLAEGGVGLIISGHTCVSPEGLAGPWHAALYGDRFIPGFAAMTAAVHQAGGKIVIQLAHAGCQADVTLTGQQAVGPSTLMAENGPRCREMTVAEIRKVIAAFGQAALRAKQAGCDGIQIHAAHGYLLSEFLSPFFNKRDDAYGGSLANRARIVREVLQNIRERVGTDLPVMVKLNASDFLEGGVDVESMLATASLLEQDGIDAIELSGGTAYSGDYLPIRRCHNEAKGDDVFNLEAARRYMERIGVPLMLVGGIRSLEVAERLVIDKLVDFVSLSRPLIREPGLIKRWQSGDTRKAACLSDNLCFKAAKSGGGIYCVVESKQREQ